MVGRDNMRVKTKEAIHMLLMIIKRGGEGEGGGGESQLFEQPLYHFHKSYKLKCSY